MKGAGWLDAALEATVVGGFSRLGYAARSRMFDWPADPDLTGLRVLVTGGTSGLGFAAATRLANAGARVAISGRDQARLDDAADRIGAGAARPVTTRADAGELDEVARSFHEAVAGLGGLDVVINNAGALTHDYRTTSQGYEQTFAVHVLGPFLLTELALPQIGAHGRIITVASGGMYSERLDPATMQMTREDYDGVAAYARAKRVQVSLNAQWVLRLPDGPVFAAMHPGWADTPGVQDSLPGFRRITAPILRTPDQGADTAVWLTYAQVPTGQFWLDRRPRSTVRIPGRGADPKDAERAFHEVADMVAAYGPEAEVAASLPTIEA